MIRKQLCALLALLWSVYSVQAQELKEWRFWDASDGFEESWCSGIAMDNSGTIYVNHGIVNHMSILDGYTVHQITSPSTHVAIRFDPDNELWAFSADFLSGKLDGFKKFDKKSGQWILYPFSDGSNFTFSSLSQRFEAPVKNRLVYAQPDRVVEFNPNTFQCAPIVEVTDTVLGSLGPYVCGSFDKGVWISGKRGALKIIPQTKDSNLHWTIHEYPFPEDFQHESLANLIEDREGRLYGSATKLSNMKRELVCLEKGTWSVTYALDSNITRGWRDDQNQLWMVSNSLFRMNKGKVTAYNHSVITTERTEESLIDQENVFWLATTQGLARHSPTVWSIPNDLSDFVDTCSMVTETPPGCLWFATSYCLIRFQDSRATFYPYPTQMGVNIIGNISTILPKNIRTMPDGRIFMGGSDPGLFFFNPKKECFEFQKQSMPHLIRIYHRNSPTIWIHASFPDKQNLMIGKYDGESIQIIPELDDFVKMKWVPDIVETTEGDLWLGHIEKQGPVLYRNQRLQYFGHEDGYLDSGAFAYLDRGDGRIWVGGRESIWEYDGNRWTALRSGMDTVRCMIQSRDGSVWVGSCSGLHHYRNGNWITYTSEDGLPNTQVRTVYEDSQGRIWAGTVHGIALYQPEADRDPPETYISQKDNTIRIAPGEEARFVYTGMDKWKQTESHRLLYSSRVDDNKWSPFTVATIAAYKDLSPGRHCFEVRAMDRNWNVDSTPAVFSFTVLLPWYRQPMFLFTAGMGSVLLLLALAFALSRHFHLERLVARRTQALQAAHDTLLEQRQRLRALAGEMALVEERERRHIAEDLHDRIGHGLAAGQMQIETLQKENLDEKLAKMVERTRALIREVIEDTRTLTFEISPSVLYELGLEAAVEWLARSVEDQHGLKVEIVDDGQPKKLEPDTRGAVYRAVRELLFNICKHAGTNEAVVTLSRENGFVCVEVSDCGRGFDVNSVQGKSAPERGFGLLSIRERMEHLEGKFECVSKPDQGTRITIMVPVDHHDESYLS